MDHLSNRGENGFVTAEGSASKGNKCSRGVLNGKTRWHPVSVRRGGFFNIKEGYLIFYLA